MSRTAIVLRIVLALLVISPITPPVAVAQEGPPLQLDVRVFVKRQEDIGAVFKRRLQPGDATVATRVRNLPGDDTARVMLHFDYKTDADIALDQIISRIVIAFEDAEGNEWSRSVIQPNEIHLNPNRVPLYYSATLYKPPGTGRYIVRLKVFGNYE